MYKLLAIDIDGTLLNDKHEITKEVHEALEKARKMGVKIVLCSGRAIGGVTRFVDELGLNGKDEFVVAYNGSLIQNISTNEALMKKTLSLEDLRNLYRLSRDLDTSVSFFDESNIYTPNENIHRYTVLEAYLSQIPLYYRKLEDISADMPVLKITFVDDGDHMDKVIDSIPLSFRGKYAMVRSTPYYFEFLHPTATKGNAVKKIAEHLNIKQEEVICIGDSENDLSMIQYAGCGVAMGNAIDELKQQANFQTVSNNESGVAHAINKLIL